MVDFWSNRSAANARQTGEEDVTQTMTQAVTAHSFTTQATLRRARRMQQIIAVMQRVAARLGLQDTALALDLAEAGAEADIERLLDGEARRRLSA